MCLRTTSIMKGILLLVMLVPPLSAPPEPAAASGPFSGESGGVKNHDSCGVITAVSEKPVPPVFQERACQSKTGGTHVPVINRYQEVLQGLRRDSYKMRLTTVGPFRHGCRGLALSGEAAVPTDHGGDGAPRPLSAPVGWMQVYEWLKETGI